MRPCSARTTSEPAVECGWYARSVCWSWCLWRQHISHRSTPEPPAPPGQNAGPRRRWQRAIAGRTVNRSRCQNSAIIRRSAGAESMRRRRLSHRSSQRARYRPPALLQPHPKPPRASGRRKDERRSRTDGGMLAYGAATLRRVGRTEVEKVRGKLVANLEKQAKALSVAPGAPGATHVLWTPGATFRAVARTGTHVLCTGAPCNIQSCCWFLKIQLSRLDQQGLDGTCARTHARTHARAEAQARARARGAQAWGQPGMCTRVHVRMRRQRGDGRWCGRGRSSC